MPLVRNLTGDSIREQLQRAYVALSTVFLAHRGGGCGTVELFDPVALDAAVCGTEAHVDLRVVRQECDLIDADEERPGEIFDNLCHMFVLLQASDILSRALDLVPAYCSPTQQFDYQKRRIADLEGEGWSLEAYGGGNANNNGKLAKDIRTLRNSALAGNRTFLALRLRAWPAIVGWLPNTIQPIQCRCAPSHGGPFTAVARAQLCDHVNDVAVIEIFEMNILDEN